MYKAYKYMALKFTKNQISILEMFFRHPEKSYYLRELGRMLGKEPGVFQREINKLVEQGILASERIAVSRFFRLNKKHALYLEYKSIFFKTFGAEAQLKSALERIKSIEVAFIFGSFAKNKEDQFSDIDLMIIGHPDEDRLIAEVSKIEKALDREINYNIFSRKDLVRGLKGGELFLEEVLRNSKIFILGDQDVLEKIIGK